MIKGLNYQPWISENYLSGNGKYGKLLILGESHYDDLDEDEDQKDYDIENGKTDSIDEPNDIFIENNFTSGVINKFINKEIDIAFYRNVGLLFNPNDKYEIWTHIAFANGIQVPMGDSNAQPSVKDIKTVEKAFWLLMENLEPDKILVCSKRMWNNWLGEKTPNSRYLCSISENNKKSTIWEYELSNKKIHAMGINHPSKFFSHKNWTPIVTKFLKDEFPK